ncbi:hybrid sensor histidine kinase/response regulator [Melaminivora sp.]
MSTTDAAAPMGTEWAPGEQDLGPLAWVLDELRKSLEGAVKAMRRFVRDAEIARQSDLASLDAGPLRIARQQLHQAGGALEMVGMAQPALLVRALESAVQRFVQRPELCGDEAAGVVERASFALIEYLEHVLAGKPVSPVSLFPQYRQAQTLAGAERVHPADLWPAERRLREPELPLRAEPLTYGPQARARLDSAVLRVVKSGDRQAAAGLQAAALGLAAGQMERQPRAFWKIAAGFFEALAQGALPPDVYVKRVASRVLMQYASLAKGDVNLNDRLLQDLLFFCAQAAELDPGQAPALAAVRQTYGLDKHKPVDYEQPRFGLYDPALLTQARKRIAAATETWSALAGGDRSKLKPAADQFSLVCDSLRKLQPESEVMAQALMQAVDAAVQTGEPPTPSLAIEVATAVLYLQASFEDMDAEHRHVAERAQSLAKRVADVSAGGQPQPLEPWMEDLYRRVSDQQTMGSVVGELRAALAEAEKSMDQFFRNPQDMAVLAPVPGGLQQMRGVLSVLGLDQASLAVMHMRGMVERLMTGGVPQDETAQVFDRLGNSLGALGFLIDMLSYQRTMARKLFVYDEELGELRILMGRTRARSSDSLEQAEAGLQRREAAADALELAGGQAFTPSQASTQPRAAEAAQSLAAAPVVPAAPAAPAAEWSAAPAIPEAPEACVASATDMLAFDWTPSPQPEPEAALSVPRPASPTALAPPVPPATSQTPVPAASNTDEDDDGELLDIFLEEAREVVTNGLAAIEVLQQQPGDLSEQTTLRRAFHTLKGSSRMVGLTEFGEAAWAMEQALNAWLAEQKPIPPALLELSQQALTAFGRWADDITQGQAQDWQAQSFRTAADTMRQEGRLLALATPGAQPEAAPPQEQPEEQPEEQVQAAAPALPDEASPAPQDAVAMAPPEPSSVSEPAWPLEPEGLPELLSDALPEPAPELVLDLGQELSLELPPLADAPVPPESSAQPVLPESSPEPLPAMAAAGELESFDLGQDAEIMLDFADTSIEGVLEPQREQEPQGLELDEDIDFAVFEQALQTTPAAVPQPLLEAEIDAEAQAVFEPVLEPAPEPGLVLEQIPEPLPAPAADDAALADMPAFEAAQVTDGIDSIDAIEVGDLGDLGDTSSTADSQSESADTRLPADALEDVFFLGADAGSQLLELLPGDEPEAVAAPAAVEPVLELQPELQPDGSQAPPPEAAAPIATPPEPLADEVKVIGSLSIGIPLYTVYLNEADEWSRRLVTSLQEWALELHQPVPETAVALAHSLAGSSATVGFTALSELARLLEHALQHLQLLPYGLPEHAQAANAAADDIRRLLHQFAAGFLKEAQPQVLAQVRALLDIEISSAPAPLTSLEADILAMQAELDAPDRLEDVQEAVVQVAEAPASVPPLLFVPSVPPPAPQAAGSLQSGFDSHDIEVEAAIARAMASAQDDDDDIDVLDVIDPDLFPIFEEEAAELLPSLGGALRQWSARPDNLSARSELLRALHTLKGSARLAGAMRLGEMAHRMETAVEQIDLEAAHSAEIDVLLGRLDSLQADFDALRTISTQPLGEPVTVSPLTPQLVQAQAAAQADTAPEASPAGSLPQAVAAASPTPRPSAPQPASMARSASGQSVRVRARLLDRLVNQAGEVMIARSRLDARMVQMRASLTELSGNLERLRQQLRDIEVQAESQMQSRLALSKDSAAGFDPLEFDRFTRVQELTRMMAESVNDVATVQRNMQRTMEHAEDDLIVQGRQARELQRDLLRTRMIEFEAIAERLYAVVRQSSKETGKQVKLDIAGGAIEMDRGVLDRMTPVFEHLLRNCVSHGIELPEQRQAAGKPLSGVITISLRQEGNDVWTEFRDDGAGLDIERIRAKAVTQGLIAPDADLSDADAAALIFQPGFTTATQVTGLAGRGIGMDVVRTEVSALGGRIETETARGQGAVFRMVLPLTTAVTQVVMLRAGTLVFGVPAALVEIVRRADEGQLGSAYATQGIEHAGQTLPFHWAGTLLQSSARSDEATGKTRPVVILRSAAQRLAMHVDEVLGNQEVVVKNLGPQLSRLPGLAGMSVLASGAVVLIYNPVALANVYGEQLQAGVLAPPLLPASQGAAASAETGQAMPALAGPTQVPLVLVVDDSITVRRVTQRLLVREGYRVALAADGLQALERLQQERPTVVLSDIEMPRMDGFDLARNIRSDPALQDLPIIMITSRIAQKHREHAMELGVNHYLGKPYSDEELLSLVLHYAQQAQQAQPVH